MLARVSPDDLLRATGGRPADLGGTPWRWLMLSESHELYCLVDAAHWDWLAQWRWNWGWHNRTPWKFYAKRNVGAARSTLYLHRELLRAIDPRDAVFEAAHVVDHINGNSLDNRRANLRWATKAQNNATRLHRLKIPPLAMIAAQLLAAEGAASFAAEAPF